MPVVSTTWAVDSLYVIIPCADGVKFSMRNGIFSSPSCPLRVCPDFVLVRSEFRLSCMQGHICTCFCSFIVCYQLTAVGVEFALRCVGLLVLGGYNIIITYVYLVSWYLIIKHEFLNSIGQTSLWTQAVSAAARVAGGC